MNYTEAVEQYGSQRQAARALGLPRTTFQERLWKEKDAKPVEGTVMHLKQTNGRINLQVKDGMVVVFSDLHAWPGDDSTAFRGLVKFIEHYKPVAVINAGDAFDGAAVSRWPSTSWEDYEARPTVKQELEACQEHLKKIESVCDGKLIWNMGNHDLRLEAKIIGAAPELAGLPGTRLMDYFPQWKPCWSCWINDDVVVKHRFRSGVHAGHMNTVNAGVTTVTGHTHALEVKPFTDYRGTRYGVQCGTVSALEGAKFAYGEDNPSNHRSGFVVLTFRDGKLLQPETVSAWDENHVDFRGKLWRVR